MSKLPFFPFYVSDFKSATDYLDPEDVGLYVRLLCLLWDTPTCSFPNDFELIKRKLLIKNDVYNDKLNNILSEFFTVKRGKYIQKRLMQEYVNANDSFKKHSKAGKKGVEAKSLKKKKKGSSYEQAMNKRSLSYEQASTSTSTIKNIKKDFEVFWNKYPQRKGDSKKQCFDKYKSLIKNGVGPDRILTALNNYEYNDGYQDGCKKWLNKELWENGDVSTKLNGSTKIGVGNWTPFLEKYLQTGIWDVEQCGPVPVIDGFYNPDCKAPKDKIKQILNVGDLI